MKKIEYGLHHSAEGYTSIEYITRLNARKDEIDDLKEITENIMVIDIYPGVNSISRRQFEDL